MLNTVKIPKQFEPIFEKAQEFVSRYFERKKEDPLKGSIEIFGERYIPEFHAVFTHYTF